MSKFEYSEYADPIAKPAHATSEAKSAFTNKMLGLPVGKAFIVSGMPVTSIGSRVTSFKVRHGGQFKVNNLKDGRFQITRLE